MRNHVLLSHPLFRVLSLAAVSIALVFLSGCPVAVDDGFGPQILDLTVDPSSIPYQDPLPHDEDFEVTISTQNLDGEIVDANVFIGDQERTAVYDDMEVIDGNIVVLSGIAYTWFEGYDPGVHNIGAEVDSENGYIFELDLATVTLEQ